MNNSILLSNIKINKISVANVDTDVGKKLFLPCKLGFDSTCLQEAFAFFDSGAGLPLVNLQYLLTLYPKYNKAKILKLTTKSHYNLISITGHSMKILGTIDLFFTLPSLNEIAKIQFYVSDGMDDPLLINMNTLKNFKIAVSFYENPPKLFVDVVPRIFLESYYLNDTERHTCVSDHVVLQSKEIKLVFFHVHALAFFKVGQHLFITQDKIPYEEMGFIKIIPTIADLRIYKNNFVLPGYVENLGNGNFEGNIKGTLVPVHHSPTIPIPDDDEKLMSLVSTFNKNNTLIYYECRLPAQTEFSIQNICFHENFSDTEKENYHISNMNIHFPKNSPFFSNTHCKNNDVNTKGKSLTEERIDIKEKIIPKHELPKYYDPKQTIQLGFNSDCIITPDDLLPKGLDIPNTMLANATDMVLEKNFKPHIWPFVKDIFLDSYPKVVSLHSLDRGNISATCGYYQIRLKDNVELPRMKKIYYENSANAELLRDVLEFLVKTKVLNKASVEGGDLPAFSSPCFLVFRKDKRNQAARLVVDFRGINELIMVEPVAISNFKMLLNTMRDAVIFSSLDLKSAFQSIELTEDSKKYTQFSTMFGTFVFNTLCTGMASSPTALSRFVDKMINMVPKYNNNKLLLDSKGFPILECNKLDNVLIYYDDILIFSHPEDTYENTLKTHFKLVKIVISRLAWHNAKLDMTKAHLGCAQINFLGWLIGNNFCQADPKRIEAIANLPFPKCQTGMRGFCGSLNFLRDTLNFTILKDIHYLTPLTSSKLDKFEPTDLQKQKFKQLQQNLMEGPLYCKIILKGVPKILMTDSASGENSQFGCILGQLVPPKQNYLTVPPELNLDDETHQIIYDNKLPVKPIPPFLPGSCPTKFIENISLSHPPETKYLTENTLGYDLHVDNSLGISLKSMLLAYSCTMDFGKICNSTYEYIKGHVGYHMILDRDFKGDKTKMQEYLNNIKNGIFYIDENLQILHALAQVLIRTFTVVNSTTILNGKKLISFNVGKKKVPFFFLLYKRDDKLIIRPSFVDKHSSYNLGKHAGTFEIILYHSKRIPKEFKHQNIMNLELYALVESLRAVEKIISHDEVICLVDNKVVYYAFNKEVISSKNNVTNWGPVIGVNFPGINLAFIKTEHNPSDFLTRIFHITKSDIKRTKLPYYVDPLLDSHMPEENIISLKDWISWVEANPQFIKQGIPPPSANIKRLTVSNKTSVWDTVRPFIIDKINNNLLKLAYGPNFSISPLPFSINVTFQQSTDKIISQLRFASSPQTPKVNYSLKQSAISRPLPLNPPSHSCSYILPKPITKPYFQCSTPYLPHHLSINATFTKNQSLETEIPEGKTLGSALSLNMALKNAERIYDPIHDLEKLLTLDYIIKLQQIQYQDIYDKCVISISNSVTENNRTYTLHNGILYIKWDKSCLKLLIPDKLLTKYIALAHLMSNHSGPRKMILLLTSYYHPNLQNLCYKFANGCIACLLVNHPRRSEHLGLFPFNTDVGEVLHMDLMESLNPSSGYNHILVVKCIISNYVILCPLFEKTAKEFVYVFANHIWTMLRPKALYTDNGSLFTAKKTLRTLFKMGTQVIFSSAYTPASHGNAESFVKIFKYVLKKCLATKDDYNWTLLPSYIADIHNHTPNSKTGYTPSQLVFGPDRHLSSTFLDDPFPKLHPNIRNEKEHLIAMSAKLKTILNQAKQQEIRDREKRNEILNKNKIRGLFYPGDIVLCKDRQKLQGNTRPLKTLYENVPYIVIHIHESTLLLCRLGDTRTIFRSKNDVKHYTPLNPDFEDLPSIVKNICSNTKFDLKQDDINALLKEGNFNFESFIEQADLDPDILEYLDSMDSAPPNVSLTDEEIERDFLDDIDQRITRSNKHSIFKNIRENLTSNSNENKQVRFFIPDK